LFIRHLVSGARPGTGRKVRGWHQQITCEERQLQETGREAQHCPNCQAAGFAVLVGNPMAIEIVDLPIKMVIFHSFLYVHQRVSCLRWPKISKEFLVEKTRQGELLNQLELGGPRPAADSNLIFNQKNTGNS